MRESVKNRSGDLEEVESSKSGRKGNSGTDDPPDGGFHAWLIVIASFLTNGIVFGIHNCYGIIYVRLKSELERTGVNDAALKACKSSVHVLLDGLGAIKVNADWLIIFCHWCLFFQL